MAVISRDEMTFTQVVSQYFLALKGRGLMLSARDLELVREWESQGAPVRVVCAGIKAAFDAHRKAHPAPTARPPASLSHCRKAVERALKSWRESRVGSRSDGSDE